MNQRLVQLPIFTFAPASAMAAELSLPTISTNLFQRLIRNPRAESDRAKERECCEMLCAILLNAPTLRNHLIRWMARHVGFPPAMLDDLMFAIDTEQAIGSKRDDLRVVATSDRSVDEHPVFIWTVEVKVGASFHESEQQFGTDADGHADEDRLPVNQLLNYDHWLAAQPAQHRAGFVLALTDRTSDLPTPLICPWACLSWTGLGEQIALALRGDDLPEGEQLLARHALGFIRNNLWRTSEMADTRLDYNDVSLIRAFAVLAQECEEKVEQLVEPLVEVMEKSGIGSGEVGRASSLFKGNGSAHVSRKLGQDSTVYAGIGGDTSDGQDFLSVWFDTPGKHAQKAAFRGQLKAIEPKLRERNQKWRVASEEVQSGWAGWTDCHLTVPLATLLVADDQQKAVVTFVQDALNDLKETGIIDAFNRTIGSNVTHNRS